MLIIEIFPIVLSVWPVSPCWLFKRVCVISSKDPSSVSSWPNEENPQCRKSPLTQLLLTSPTPPNFKALKAQQQAYHQNVLLNESPTSPLWDDLRSLQGILLQLPGEMEVWGKLWQSLAKPKLAIPTFRFLLKRLEWEGWGESWGSWGRWAAMGVETHCFYSFRMWGALFVSLHQPRTIYTIEKVFSTSISKFKEKSLTD